MKKIFILVFSLFVILCLGGVVYADETSVVTTDKVNSLSEVTTSGTTENTTIGSSSINVVVNQDNMFTGLKTLVDFYGSSLDKSNKDLFYKELVFFVTDCRINGGYTLETFKTAFIEVFKKYGIEITEDVDNAITQYIVYYLADCFKDDGTDYLVWIGSSLGLMITLFITSQQGGVHRA